MNPSTNQARRDILLGFAAAAVSGISILPLLWGLFLFGDYGDRPTDPFPGFLLGAVAVSLFIIVVGAFCIGPFWRLSPSGLGKAAAAPYWVLALLSGSLGGITVFIAAGFLVLGVFVGVTRYTHPAARNGPT